MIVATDGEFRVTIELYMTALSGRTIYISGPITGICNWQDNFMAAEKELMEHEFAPRIVLNPVKIGKIVELKFGRKKISYSDYMRKDIECLVKCNAICMLPGWKHSKGAKMEYEIAKILDMAVFEYLPV